MIHSITTPQTVRPSVGPSPDHTRLSASGLNASISRDTPIKSASRPIRNPLRRRSAIRSAARDALDTADGLPLSPVTTLILRLRRRGVQLSLSLSLCCCSSASSTNHVHDMDMHNVRRKLTSCHFNLPHGTGTINEKELEIKTNEHIRPDPRSIHRTLTA